MKKSLLDPIEPGDFIKHDMFMDVAFQVEYCYAMTSDTWRVTGYWWNQMFVKSGMVAFKNLAKRRNRDPYSTYGSYGPDSQTFDIKTENLPKWMKLKMPPRSECLRKCEWLRVA